MSDYRQELERRVAQFTGYLEKMHDRAHNEVCGNCFIIFKERNPNDNAEDPALDDAVPFPLELIESAFGESGIGGSLTENGASRDCDLPDEGWKADNSSNRFVQFSFERNWFCLDLPLQTLFWDEAIEILRFRQGFFYVRNRPEFTLKGEELDGYNPFRKIYLYGDEHFAAEDMAFIFFHVWRFPVDWQFYVKAAAFGDKKTDWENGVSIP